MFYLSLVVWRSDSHYKSDHTVVYVFFSVSRIVFYFELEINRQDLS